MHQPTCSAAVFGIIRNEKGEILFSRRSNTGHLDGYLSLPAGHVESGETVTEAMIRELEEEVGIIATDLHISISQQSMNRDDGMTYFNTFFEINNYTEVVSNKETDKCSELIFLSLDALKDEKVAPYLCPPCTRVRQRWTDFLGNPVGDHTIIVYSFSLHPMNFGPFLIVLAAALWALDSILRRSLYGLPPSTLIFFEHILGFLIIGPFALKHYKQVHFTKKEKTSIFVVSLLSGVIGTLLFTMALGAVGFIPFSVAILIQKFQPIFAIGLAMMIGKERIPRLSYLFIVLALLAGYFVTFPHGISMTPDGQKEILAALYALAAAAAWGSSTNFSKYLLNNHHPEVITMLRFALTASIIA